MRRLIAYICMAVAILIGVGVSFAPTFINMKEGREFASGREIVFSLSNKENEEDPVSADAAEKVAEIMKQRLDQMSVEDYSVKIGTNYDDPSQVYADTISVSFSTQDDTLFNFVSRLLEFDGQDFSLRGNLDEVFAEDVFKDVEATIYRDSGTIPYVIFPVSDSEAVKTFLKTVSGEDESGDEGNAALVHAPRYADVVEGEGESEEQNNPDVFLVGNWAEDDSIENASENPYSSEKIICSWRHDNIWNPDSKEAETELRFLCGSANEEGQYDLTALKRANQQAAFLVGMFNASSYSVNVKNMLKNVSSTGGISYNYLTTQATYESLISHTGIDARIAFSATFKAMAIGVIVVSLLLVMFFRIHALGAIASILGSVYLTYLLFFAMTPTFNVGAIIGGIVVTLLGVFMSVANMHKFREEVYKGRSLKKANQEATRKTNILSIDASVVVAFLGLMFYLLGGETLKSLGVIAFFGALITLLVYHIVFRILNWLLANATGIQRSYGLFNIDESKVPNIALDEKPTYVAPYEKTDFTKRRKVFGIIAGVLCAASLAGIITFGVLNGSPINTKRSSTDTTVIYTSVRVDDDRLNASLFKDNILANVLVDGKAIKVSGDNISLTQKVAYDLDEKLDKKTYVYVAKIDGVLSNDKVTYKVGEETYPAETIAEAVETLVQQAEVSGTVTSEVRSTSETVTTPDQSAIAIASAVTVAGAALYCAIRYRLSRGLSTLVITSGVGLVTYGLLTLTRLATAPVSALLLPMSIVTSLLVSFFYLHKEKEMFKEEKANDAAKRSSVMVRAVSLSALPIFSFSLIGGYLAINFFGFGPIELTILFGAIIVATILSVLAVLTLMGPLSAWLDKLLSNVKLPKFRRNKDNRPNRVARPKTSEPQETIFIGIND